MSENNIHQFLDSAAHNASLTEQIGLFASIVHTFSSSLKLEETLKTTIDQITTYLNCEAASLFLLEHDDQELVCKICVGPVDITGWRLPSDHGIVGKTVQSRDTQIILDTRDEEGFYGGVDKKTGFETRSILCVPLIVKDKCIGVLEAINKASGSHLFAESDKLTLQILADFATLAIYNARMASALVEQERIQKELELAREIQRSLLPSDNEAHLHVFGINEPAREVSGDFYDWYVLDNGNVFFSLGDVSGKGMNAALLMATTTSLLHCLAKTAANLSQLMSQVNNEVCEAATRGMFVTVVAGILEPENRIVRWVNAGHQPPLFHYRDDSFKEIAASTPPLGLIPDLSFPELRASLRDASFYLFTDGVTESVNDKGNTIEVEGLQSLLRQHNALRPKQRLEVIVDHIRQHNPKAHDDVTLLLLE